LVAVDHSILTTSNPHQEWAYWGIPDPFIRQRRDQARLDEVTASVIWNPTWDLDFAKTWGQAGAGVRGHGNAGGGDLQNQTHVLIGLGQDRLPYARSRWKLAPLALTGAGIDVSLARAVDLRLGSMLQATPAGRLTWQTESLLRVESAHGGSFAGLRWQGWQGEDPLVVTRAVADHEAGPMAVAGWRLRSGPWDLGLETGRNLSSDGQMGHFTLTYHMQDGGLAAASDEAAWRTRAGLLPWESRVPGRGIDYAVARRTGSVWWSLGVRDQELKVPYPFDMSARRMMVWGGAGAPTTLLRGEGWSLDGWSEAGLGWRSSTVASQGFLTVNNRRSATVEQPLARIAAGIAPSISWREVELGLLGLLEGTLAPSKSVTVATRHVSNPQEIARESTFAVEGPSFGMILAVTTVWRW
jgi:hypothetical protein